MKNIFVIQGKGLNSKWWEKKSPKQIKIYVIENEFRKTEVNDIFVTTVQQLREQDLVSDGDQ